MDQMPAQIGLPIVDRTCLEDVVGGLEEIGLADVDVARLGQLDLLEIIRPIPVRRERLQLGLRHLVVILLRIAQLDAGARRLARAKFPAP